MTTTTADLLAMNTRQLMEALLAGHPLDPSALDDTEYRGLSLGTPRWFEQLTWKQFKKTFHRDPSTGRLRGWNVRMEQHSVEGPWVMKRKGGEPVTFGHYEVVAPRERDRRQGWGQGLLIDYGRGGNGLFDPMRWVRDPLVSVNAGSAELLLGGSYVHLGFALWTPLFFSLQRDCALTHVHAPPRPPA